MIAHPDRSQVGRAALAKEQMEVVRAEASGSLSDGKLTAFSRIDTCGWYLVAIADRASLPRPAGPAAGLLVVVVTATILVAMVIVMMIAYNMMLGRTTLLINQAVQALESEGGANAGEECGRMDALVRLRASAGKMASAAQKIVEERYRNRLAISEYQMQALQAQIKPHFLYNTLDVIKWMIADGDVENGVWMVNALSKYLRMSINKGPAVVTLSEEMALTQNYLGIMQRRFKNAFKVAVEIEPKAMDCLIPRFSLQPLVENALLHGLMHCERNDKKLTVRAWREGGRDEGYGVANVRKRLMLFGGAEASFRVASREGAGTCVSIALPARFVQEPE